MHVLEEEVGILRCKGRIAWVPVERRGMVLRVAGQRVAAMRTKPPLSGAQSAEQTEPMAKPGLPAQPATHLRRSTDSKGISRMTSPAFRSRLATTPRRQVGQAWPKANPRCRGSAAAVGVS